MASTCDSCGYRNSEVYADFLSVFLYFEGWNKIFLFTLQLKPGGRIPEKGKKITLNVKNVNDLSRDVIKVCNFILDLN